VPADVIARLDVILGYLNAENARDDIMRWLMDAHTKSIGLCASHDGERKLGMDAAFRILPEDEKGPVTIGVYALSLENEAHNIVTWKIPKSRAQVLS